MRAFHPLRFLVCLVSCLAAAHAADPLDKTATFTPSITFTETHSEKVVGAAGSREVTVSQSANATLVANLGGIVLGNINASTAFELNFGGAHVSFTLGEIPTYVPGQTTAFYCWNGWDGANKPLGTSGVKLIWSATKLTVTLTMRNEVSRPSAIACDDFLGAVDPDTSGPIGLRDSVDVDVRFGPIGSTPRKVYFTGTSSVSHASFAATSEEFDLNAVSVTGSADYTAPKVALLTPAQGALVGAAITLTGSASDEHGLDKVRWSPDPATPSAWEDVTTSILAPPANGLWGTTTAAWTLDLTNLPHGITKLWVKSVDESHNESPAKLITLVNPLLAPVAGRWIAALAPTNAVGALRGAISLAFAANGSCTGTLTLEKATHAFTGSLLADESLLITIKRTGLPNLVITGTLNSFSPVNAAAGLLTGAVSVDGTTLATFAARRAPYSNSVLAEAALAGRFNLISSLPTAPYGHAYLIALTARNGVASISGRLPDGISITWSGALETDGSLPMFVRLYGNGGSLSGTVTIDSSSHSVPGSSVKWVRPASYSDKQFPAGFTQDMLVAGVAYSAPLAGTRVMNLASSTFNAKAAWTPDALTLPTEVTFTVNANNSLLVPANPQGLALTLSPATGLWTGSFRVPAAATGTATVAAAVYLLIDSTSARGFYVAPALTGSTAKRFGLITIAAP